MHRSQTPSEQLGLAKRDANRTWQPSRIVNSWLPAIQAGPKNLQTFNRLRKAASPNTNEPFDYHELLKELGHNESEAQHLLGSSNAAHTDLKTSDDPTAIQNEKERCAGCVRLAKSQRETAESLLVARNVIESLEASVSLLQTRLALYEGGINALAHVVSSSDEETPPPSTQDGTTSSASSGSSGNDADPHKKSKSAERTVTSTAKEAESFDRARVNAPPFAATDVAAFGQDDSQTRKDRAQTLVKFGGKIRALAAVLATQSKQIEQLKSANTELATRENRLTKNLRAAEAAQRDAQETVQFQAKVMEFLASEAQAQRSAAEYDTARLLYALRHERSKRRAAECDMNAIKNELVLLFPKLTTASKSDEQGEGRFDKQPSGLGFRTENQPSGRAPCDIE